MVFHRLTALGCYTYSLLTSFYQLEKGELYTPVCAQIAASFKYA